MNEQRKKDYENTIKEVAEILKMTVEEVEKILKKVMTSLKKRCII